MRHLVGCLIAASFVACSGGGNPNPNPNPGPGPGPMEPAPKPVYTEQTWPSGTFGFNQGNVIRENLKFKAILPNAPSGTVGEVNFNDFYDSTGERGINSVLVITSAEWCGACQAEASTLESKIKSMWGAEGVFVVELMLEDTTMKRDDLSVTSAADRWRTKFSLTDMAVGIDPAFTMATGSSGTIGLPLNHVINPRDMTVALKQMGSGGTVESVISSMVAKNKIQ